MIYFSGIAEVEIDIEKGSARPSGHMWDMAVMARRELDPRVSFLGGLSSDAAGQKVLSALVEEKIVFDPLLVSQTRPSFLRVGSEASGWMSYGTGTAPVSVSTEQVSGSLADASDVNQVVIGGQGLFWQPVFSSILDAALFSGQKPKIIVDPAAGAFACSDPERLASNIRKAASEADLLILDSPTAALLGDGADEICRLTAVLADDGSVTVGKQSCKGGRKEIYRRVIAGELFA